MTVSFGQLASAGSADWQFLSTPPCTDSLKLERTIHVTPRRGGCLRCTRETPSLALATRMRRFLTFVSSRAAHAPPNLRAHSVRVSALLASRVPRTRNRNTAVVRGVDFSCTASKMCYMQATIAHARAANVTYFCIEPSATPVHCARRSLWCWDVCQHNGTRGVL